MAEKRSFTKVELLALELIIAVAQQKGAAPGSVLKDDADKAAAWADHIMQKALAAAGGKLKINEKVLNPQIKSASSKMGPEPTLKQLMELHAEAVRNVK